MPHCPALAAGDCRAAAMALARSGTLLLGAPQAPARVARQASAVHCLHRQYGPSPPGEHTAHP
eukprot:8917828-Alexandrium_andersonii.AAC.1